MYFSLSLLVGKLKIHFPCNYIYILYIQLVVCCSRKLSELSGILSLPPPAPAAVWNISLSYTILNSLTPPPTPTPHKNDLDKGLSHEIWDECKWWNKIYCAGSSCNKLLCCVQKSQIFHWAHQLTIQAVKTPPPPPFTLSPPPSIMKLKQREVSLFMITISLYPVLDESSNPFQDYF